MDGGQQRGRPAWRFSRRSLLASAGAVGLAVAGGAVAAARSTPVGQVVERSLGLATTVSETPPRPVTRIERLYSKARGRQVDMVTILPANVPAKGLPVSLLLHGLNGSARTAAVGGMPTVLAASVANGSVPPYAFVALDGGDNYWHENHPGDDPMAMLLDEVPQWLARRGLGGPHGLPFACTGVSMGGFGALLYARRRNERRQPASAIATISPGLLLSWTEMSKRHAFADEAQWASLDPLRHIDELGDQPIGVWIGDQDRFIEGTRKFIAQAHPAVGVVGHGMHNDAYWRTVVPDAIRFVGKYAPKTSRRG